MPFDDPDETGSGGTRLNPRDIVNHLLLVWAVDYIPHSPTQFSRPDKPSDVIVVDVVDLDQVDENGVPGLCARKTWWRQAQLIQALKNKIGNPRDKAILARMMRGGATMGRNAPYQLTSMTADPMCVNRANQWLQINPDFQPSQPGAHPPAPMSPPMAPYPVDPGQYDHYPPQHTLPPPTPQGRPVTPAEQTILERLARQSVDPTRGFQGEPPPF